MIKKICPSCKEEQLWDELLGYSNQYCPEFCTNNFTDSIIDIFYMENENEE